MGFLDSSAGKKIRLQCRRPRFDPWVGNIPWRRDRIPAPVFLGFPCGSAGKESTCSAGDLSSIPGLGRSPGEGIGYPCQYSGLENSMDLQRVGHDWVTFIFSLLIEWNTSQIWGRSFPCLAKSPGEFFKNTHSKDPSQRSWLSNQGWEWSLSVSLPLQSFTWSW